MLSLKILVASIMFVIVVAFIGTVVSDIDKRKSEEESKLKQELDHKRQAGRLED